MNTDPRESIPHLISRKVYGKVNWTFRDGNGSGHFCGESLRVAVLAAYHAAGRVRLPVFDADTGLWKEHTIPAEPESSK